MNIMRMIDQFKQEVITHIDKRFDELEFKLTGKRPSPEIQKEIDFDEASEDEKKKPGRPAKN